MKVVIADFERAIDRFKEDNNRWPKSLAEAGANRIPLPPGKQASYNSTTGIVTIK